MSRNVTRSSLASALAGLVVLVGSGCTKEPGDTRLTRGTLVVACDEAVEPVMRLEIAEFQRQYPQSTIELRVMEAREAVAAFAADSVRVIVLARRLNRGESDALKDVPIEQYHVALSAVAVITHTSNPVRELRVGQLDSIYGGLIRTWPGRGRSAGIDAVIGGVNSSTNEVFRDSVMGGRGFGPAVGSRTSSPALVRYVAAGRDAIGIVGLDWVRAEGRDSVKTIALSRPGVQPDSTQAPGLAYSPAQAYVFKGYYPLSVPVMMYLRTASRDIALGFISFVAGAEGQKIFVKNGLVPVTMPVRLVQLTSEQLR